MTQKAVNCPESVAHVEGHLVPELLLLTRLLQVVESLQCHLFKNVCDKETKRQREEEQERKRDREKKRKIEKETDRKRDREKQRNRETEKRDREKETLKETNTQT